MFDSALVYHMGGVIIALSIVLFCGLTLAHRHSFSFISMVVTRYRQQDMIKSFWSGRIKHAMAGAFAD